MFAAVMVGCTEENPDIAGFPCSQGVDESFLKDGENIPRNGRKQNAYNYSGVYPDNVQKIAHILRSAA
jgi:hypothetical protein